jgi:hypothetical protein
MYPVIIEQVLNFEGCEETLPHKKWSDQFIANKYLQFCM